MLNRTRVIFAALLFASHASAAENCFQAHLKDAIALNNARRALYSELTGGSSRRVSDKLIRSEKLALALAWIFDLEARRFHEKGIPVLCQEFVPIGGAPEFQPHLDPVPPSPERMPEIDPSGIRDRLSAALKQGGFQEVERQAGKEIDALPLPSHSCMIRHVLGSVRRFAKLAPQHIAQAEAAGTASPAGLSRRLIEAHFLTLKTASELDQEAFPLQAAGIPILCQDVPPIPE